jgi:hypothetical protein
LSRRGFIGTRAGDLARTSLGSLHITRRRLATAHGVLQPALNLFRAAGDDYGVAMTHRNLALLYDTKGETDAALGAYLRAGPHRSCRLLLTN